MTVKELIETLFKYPEDTLVTTINGVGKYEFPMVVYNEKAQIISIFAL